MAAIGVNSVTVFKGRMRQSRQKIALLETDAGVDGQAIVRGGWHSDPTEIQTVTIVLNGLAAAKSLELIYTRLQGTFLQVTDQFGYVWSNVAVLAVTVELSATAFANQYRVDAAWLLLPDTVRV